MSRQVTALNKAVQAIKLAKARVASDVKAIKRAEAKVSKFAEDEYAEYLGVGEGPQRKFIDEEAKQKFIDFMSKTAKYFEEKHPDFEGWLDEDHLRHFLNEMFEVES